MSSPVSAPVLIRPLTGTVSHAVAWAYRHLGERSRHQRFLGAKPACDLERLSDVDHWHHEALIAFSPHPRKPIGVAEYVRLERFDRAELAVAVVDEWQRRGVGKALLGALRARAMAAGVRQFTAFTLRGNRGAMRLAGELGQLEVTGAADGVARLLLVL